MVDSQRAATLADVARLAGVSSAVVSYVVNDGPRPVALRPRIGYAMRSRPLATAPTVTRER